MTGRAHCFTPSSPEGECRPDILLGGSVNGGNGFATGLARLFEGASEGTSDLDGQQTIPFNVDKGATDTFEFTETNTDSPGNMAPDNVK